MAERVFITGVGAITPLGHTAEESWQAILAGRFAAEKITPFSPEMTTLYPKFTGETKVHYAAFVRGFKPESYVGNSKLIRRRTRICLMTYGAAQQALADAKLPRAEAMLEALGRGVIVGSGCANMLHLLEEGRLLEEKGRTSPYSALKIGPEQMDGTIAMLENLRGPGRTVATACASGASAIAAAMDCLRTGRADVMVAAGADSLISISEDERRLLFHPVAISPYEVIRALATGEVDDPSQISKPFTNERRGFVLGEGAAALILETESHARARGANRIAEVAGYAEVNGAEDEVFPSVDGQVAAMQLATRMARLRPEDLVHGNTHGTGTLTGDPVELASILKFRGNFAGGLHLSATKAATDHGIGFTGAWEAVETALAIRDGVIPPTHNFGQILDIPQKIVDAYGLDERYQDYPLFSKVPVHMHIPAAFSNSFGFGDHNVVLIMKAA